MKVWLALLALVMSLVALGLYLGVRSYLKRHGEEPVEMHQQWLMRRMWAICILTIAASLLGLIRLFL